MTLREACRQTASRHAPVEIRWPALGRAFASIERQWADVPIRTPPSFELEPIRKRVAATWKSFGSNSLTVNSVGMSELIRPACIDAGPHIARYSP